MSVRSVALEVTMASPFHEDLEDGCGRVYGPPGTALLDSLAEDGHDNTRAHEMLELCLDACSSDQSRYDFPGNLRASLVRLAGYATGWIDSIDQSDPETGSVA